MLDAKAFFSWKITRSLLFNEASSRTFVWKKMACTQAKHWHFAGTCWSNFFVDENVTRQSSRLYRERTVCFSWGQQFSLRIKLQKLVCGVELKSQGVSLVSRSFFLKGRAGFNRALVHSSKCKSSFLKYLKIWCGRFLHTWSNACILPMGSAKIRTECLKTIANVCSWSFLIENLLQMQFWGRHRVKMHR